MKLPTVNTLSVAKVDTYLKETSRSVPAAVIALHTIVTMTWLQNCDWSEQIAGTVGFWVYSALLLLLAGAYGGWQHWIVGKAAPGREPTVLSAVISGLSAMFGMAIIYLVLNSSSTIQCLVSDKQLFSFVAVLIFSVGSPLLVWLTQFAEKNVVKTKTTSKNPSPIRWK